MKSNPGYRLGYIVAISFISALGGYLFGFDFAVISGALPFLKDQFSLNAYWEGFTTGSLALGCIAGCLVAGKTAESYGRKPAMMVAGAVFMVSSLAMAFSASLTFFICSRFAAGIGVGMASMLSPMYIAEISPAAIRGRMVSTYQLAIVIGILVTNLVNYSLRNAGDDAWRWMFGLGAVPSALFCVGIFILPESPRWLMLKGRDDRAKKILSLFGDSGYSDGAFASIKSATAHRESISVASVFKKPFVTFIVAGVALAVLQQLCGINVVFNYTATIFESIGFTKDDQLKETVFIGAVNLLFTFLAIAFVDKIGRRPLMVLGNIGLAILYIAIALSLKAGSALSSVLLLAAIGVYAVTLAPVTWVLISEIFPNSIRGIGASIAVISLWLAYFVLTFTFPVLAQLMGGIANTFYIYSGVCVFAAIFIIARIRETKGKSLEEMGAVFTH
jgi:MFS transporter, SP family, xylose:H+ symportor